MKKVTSIILSFILLLSLVPYALAASFKDVSTSYTFYKEVIYLLPYLWWCRPVLK